MPELLARPFAAVGEELGNWLTLKRLDPAYRARFADGTSIDVRADVDAMADEIADKCGGTGRRRVPALRRLPAAALRHRAADFIDRNLDSPLQLVSPQLAKLIRLGGFGRLGRKVGAVRRGPAAAPAVLLPGDVRRARPGRRARDLRGDHLHGLRRAACTSPTAACTRCPWRWPPPRRRTASSSATGTTVAQGGRHRRPGLRGDHRRRRAHPGRRRGRERRPADRLRRPAAARLGPAAGASGCATPPRRSCCTPARRPRFPDTAHHTIDFGHGVGRDVRRDHRPRPADERPVVPAHHADAHRPVARAGRPAHPLRAVPDAEPARPGRLGQAAARATATTWSRRWRSAATPASATRSRPSTWSRPADWRAQGLAAGAPFAAAHTFRADRPVPRADARPAHRRTWSSAARTPSPASACRWC